MIGSRHRFHGRSSIQKHYSKSDSARTGMFSLRYAKSSRPTGYRAAVVVSKKVSKSAVIRNRIRRRVYENVRILSRDFKSAYDCVVLIYDENVATMPAEDLAADLKKLFVKARIVPLTASDRDIVDVKD